MFYKEILSQKNDSEIFIAIVGAIGIDLDSIYRIVFQKLKAFDYTTQHVKVSTDVIGEIFDEELMFEHENERIEYFMDKGNDLREQFTGTISLGIATKISSLREKSHEPNIRTAYFINSLKHPDEVQLLRKIYTHGFFLISIYSDEDRRIKYLTETRHIQPDKARELVRRDTDESVKHGQHTADTFHLSDFFVNIDGDSDKLQNDIWRIIDLIFGNPYITPTFDEYAMYMAFSSSLRSADLSRQVGAVITKDTAILSTGANDVPKFGGGVYWPYYCEDEKKIIDFPEGRDFKRNEDSNTRTKIEIIDKLPENVSKKFSKEEISALKEHLKSSRLKDITEYGRVVHAEMDAILNCARTNVSTLDTELFSTTFPCHNCAKHIVASGIKRVVYIEPYPKSKALDFHKDTIQLKTIKGVSDKVSFEPFVGVGPRSFFNLFSISLGSGYEVKRKSKDGRTIEWIPKKASVRMPLPAGSYLDREISMVSDLQEIIKLAKNKDD